MKNVLLVFTVLFATGLGAQSIDELKAQQAEKQAVIDDYSGKIGAVQGEIDALQKEIDILSGWRKGLNGLIGFDWSDSNGWVQSANPDAKSTSLKINLGGYLLKDNEKTFWHNRATIVEEWNDLDLHKETDNGNLFDNGITDIINASSLAGYKLSDKFALSGQGELNTTLRNFLSPGTLDFGVGVTWLPIENMTVIIHPLNYNIVFSGVDGVSSEGSLGAKVRVDYFDDFNVAGKKLHWDTNLTTYFPYSSDNSNSQYWQWLNNVSLEVWKGIGVGVGFGLRKADFESEDTQSYTSLGLSYTLK